MKRLCTYIDRCNLKAIYKYAFAIMLSCICSAGAGLIIWLCFFRHLLTDISWPLCFAGYPLFIFLWISIIYLYNHPFQNGAHLG